MATIAQVREVLLANPGLDKRRLLSALVRKGVGFSDAHALNAFLYSHQDALEWRDDTRGRAWYVRQGEMHRSSDTGQVRDGAAPVLAPPQFGGDHQLDLYPWQQRALARWRASGSRGVVEAVTGAGKTRMALQASLDALGAGQRVAVVVPTLELMRQWEREIQTHVRSRIGAQLRVHTLGGGSTSNLGLCEVLVATASSAAQYRLLPRGLAGLLIADECHHYGAEIWSRALKPHFDARLGLTATYARDDSGLETYLDPYFGGVCYRVGYEEALADDVIAQFRIAFVGVEFTGEERYQYDEATAKAGRYRGKLIDEWGLPAQPFGDFIRAAQRLSRSGEGEGSRLAGFYLSAFGKRRSILAASTAKQARMRDLSAAVAQAQRTIVFAQTVHAASAAMVELRRYGHVGEVIEATMERDDRTEAFEAFERGDYNVVAAPKLLDEGVDVPAADLAIVLATSRSRRQLIQRMGRIIRKKTDGRSARLVVLYVEGTAEDPNDGAHEDFLDEVVDVAQDVAVFPASTRARALVEYLAPHRSPPAHRRAPRPQPAPAPGGSPPPHVTERWVSDEWIVPDSVRRGCAVRHAAFGEGTVVSIGTSAYGMTVKAHFADGTHEVLFGLGRLYFIAAD